MVDGFIICGIPGLSEKNQSEDYKALMESFINRGTPFVFFSDEEQFSFFTRTLDIDLSEHGELFQLLTIDRVKAACQAVHYLIAAGHRRIALVAEDYSETYPHDIPFKRKLEGYKQAIKMHQIPFDQNLVVRGDPDYRGGEECFGYLSAIDKPPTAYFACGDTLALGVLHGARMAGYRVPQDVAVVGFDNIPISSYWNPKLSTVSIPIDQISLEAFNRLYKLMNGKTLLTNRMRFDTELIIRESSQ
jgi:LacI family repressor for deo operon, udp, cdd, tsx, nupC, and nupG